MIQALRQIWALRGWEGLTFYRCVLCQGVINEWDLKEHHACPHCGHARISPSNLSAWESLVQIAKHPKIWEWREWPNVE